METGNAADVYKEKRTGAIRVSEIDTVFILDSLQLQVRRVAFVIGALFAGRRV